MDENYIRKCIWLNCVCGHSPLLIDKCLSFIGTVEEIYGGNVNEDKLKAILRHRFGAYKTRDLSEADEIIEYCKAKGIRIVHMTDDEYPDLLRRIDVPPHILYMKGENFNINDYLCFTIVGMRRASKDGTEFTEQLSNGIAKEGVLVVSGMAAGLDAAAHMGALKAGQRTVAVLAGGVDVIYPAKNKYIYYEILKRGMVISERPPEQVGKPYFYQERNRILAGISTGTLIVEGNQKSGTSITAKYAQEYNRDIFAVPGKPTDEKAYVPNSLIRDGAITTLSADDIIYEYSSVYGEYLDNGVAALIGENPDLFKEYEDEYGYDIEKVPKANKAKKDKEEDKAKNRAKPDFDKYTNKEKIILEYLYSFDVPVHIDEIIRATKLNVSEVNSIMLMLQIKGAVQQSAGNLYSLKI